jgi:hypothetical protein
MSIRRWSNQIVCHELIGSTTDLIESEPVNPSCKSTLAALIKAEEETSSINSSSRTLWDNITPVAFIDRGLDLETQQ